MIQIKVNGGTPKSGKGLCHACKYASIVKGQNCEEFITCTAGMFPLPGNSIGPVRFRVAECGKYHPSNMPWLGEMQKMAWKIEARKRGPVGFSEGQNAEMEVVVTPPRKRDDQGLPE
jgi:hypothetical protein